MTPKFQAPNTKTLRAPALQGPPSPLPTPLPQSCCVSSDGPRLDQRDCLGNWTWQEGSEQTLKCAARGNPIPKLNCSRKGDGASLPIGDLRPVTREVAGTYLCWATSARGGVTREVVLNVLCEFEFWDGQGRGNLASSTLTTALCPPHRRPEYPGHCHSGGSCDPHLGRSGHRWLYLQLPAEDPEIRTGSSASVMDSHSPTLSSGGWDGVESSNPVTTEQILPGTSPHPWVASKSSLARCIVQK